MDVPPPPPPEDPELAGIIEKLAQFVAKNGPEFERMTAEKQRDNPRFAFLSGGEYFNYYQWRLHNELAALRGGPPVGGGFPRAPPPPLMALQTGPPPSLPSQPPPVAASPPLAAPPGPGGLPSQLSSAQAALQSLQNSVEAQMQQSESNLAAQYQSLTAAQQGQTEEALQRLRVEQAKADAQQCGFTLEQLDQAIQPLVESCTKENISRGKVWLLEKAGDSLQSCVALCGCLLARIADNQCTFQARLHLIYLFNDVLHHCKRRNFTAMISAIEGVVVPVLALAYNQDEAGHSKLDKLFTLWEQNGYFSVDTFRKLREPVESLASWQREQMSEQNLLVQGIATAVQAQYTALQKQHQEFVQHLQGQLQQQQQQVLQLTQQLQLQQQQQQAQQAQQAQQQAAVQQQVQPPIWSAPPPGFDPHQPPPGFPPPGPSPHQPPPRFEHPPPGYGAQPPPAPLPLPDLSKPPPGFAPRALLGPPPSRLGAGGGDLPMASTRMRFPAPPPDSLIPAAPYYDLPAGLMIPLIPLDASDYKPLDPIKIRLPPPLPPSESLLAAVEQYYSPPSHDRPRDSEGWERLGLYEFYKSKEKAKKASSEGRVYDRADAEADREKEWVERRGGGPGGPGGGAVPPGGAAGFRRPPGSSPASQPAPQGVQPASRPRRSRSRSRSRSASRSGSRSRSRSRTRSRSGSRSASGSRSRSRSPTPKFTSAGLGSEARGGLQESRGGGGRGAQMMRGMGWSGAGLGRREQGRVEPVEAGDRGPASGGRASDQFRGLGSRPAGNSADPFAEFRQRKSRGFVDMMAKRQEMKAAAAAAGQVDEEVQEPEGNSESRRERN